jgi:hypothetical protein
MRIATLVGALAIVLSLGGCFDEEYVENCVAAIRGQLKSPDAMTVINSKWAKAGHEVKVFLDYDAADDKGRIGRYNANCIFNGDDIVGLFTKAG